MCASEWMETLAQDLRYATRVLRAHRTFTIVATLSLAIGISANTTIFSALNAVLLRPLPYPNADRLVEILNSRVNEPGTMTEISTGDLSRWRAENQVFEQLELSSRPEMAAMSDPGHPERVSVQRITPGLLGMLGVGAIVGRIPSEQDLGKSAANPVFISYEFWERHFLGDPKILGRSFFCENEFATVVAVLSPGFDLFGQGPADIFEPWGVPTPVEPSDNGRWLEGFGKLKPGITIEQAQASMNIVSQHLAANYPESNKGFVARLEPLQQALFGGLRPLLLPLAVAAAFVLLIACTNIASLLLSRTSGRRREIGIRIALGASRVRLVRQMLTESVLLSLVGGLVGLLLSVWSIKFFLTITPLWFPQTKGIPIDGRVLAFTFAISVFTGLLFGVTPALSASKSGVNDSLKESGHSSAPAARLRARSVLVVAEVALALVLLVGAGLMINSLVRVLHADPGFDPTHLITAEIRLTGKKYFDVSQLDKTGFDLVSPQVAAFSQRVVGRIKELPGVESAAVIDWLPMADSSEVSPRGFLIGGRRATDQGERPQAMFSAVSSDYFRVMRIPSRKGRGLTERDTENAPWVVVINEAMARKFWPNQNPIGQVIALDTVPQERPREIVGIVGDVRQFELARQSQPEMYAPYPQQPAQCPPGLDEARLHKSLVIRTTAVSKSMVDAVRQTMVELAPDSPVFGLTTVQQTVSNSARSTSFFSQLLVTFAVLALLLAMIGIYGVISYSVGERTRELGLRIALGAQPRQMLTLVLKKGLLLSSFGVAVGIVASFVATPVLSSLLYGVQAHDPVTLSFVSLLLIIVGIVAAYVPALRATRVDPIVALRHE
jgi:putative ABC transport system permease protein